MFIQNVKKGGQMYKIACHITTDCPQAYSGHRNGIFYKPQKISNNQYYHIFSHDFSTRDEAYQYIQSNFVNRE